MAQCNSDLYFHTVITYNLILSFYLDSFKTYFNIGACFNISIIFCEKLNFYKSTSALGCVDTVYVQDRFIIHLCTVYQPRPLLIVYGCSEI